MITVRCPVCDAAYQLEAAKLADGGRKLKCARCKTVWLATADLAPDTPVAPETVAEPAPAAAEGEPQAPNVVASEGAGPEEEVPPPPEYDAVAAQEPAVDDVVRVGGWRSLVRGGNAWRSGAVVLVVAGLVAGGGMLAQRFWPVDVVQEQPARVAVPTAGGKVILPPEGVVLHHVRGDVKLIEGEQGGVELTVRGLLANTTSQTLVVPPMRLELLGKKGDVADMWPVSGVSGDLPGGAEQAWTVSLTAPDMSEIKGWRVVFVEEAAE